VAFGAACDLWCRRVPAIETHFGRLLGAGVACVLVASAVFTHFFRINHSARSALPQAITLRNVVGEGTTVVAGRMILSQPELFWFARVHVESPGQRMIRMGEYPPLGRWMLLHADEYRQFLRHDPLNVAVMHVLPNNRRWCYLIRYGRADTGAR
jgi:hypothetical protein